MARLCEEPMCERQQERGDRHSKSTLCAQRAGLWMIMNPIKFLQIVSFRCGIAVVGKMQPTLEQ